MPAVAPRPRRPEPTITVSEPDNDHQVVFTPSGLSGAVAEGASVLDAARALGVDLDSVCGGRGLCGRCQVVPAFGEMAKWGINVGPDHLSPPGGTETAYNTKRPMPAGQRLGCRAEIRGDVVIDVPAASQVHKQVIAKDVDVGRLDVDPVVRLHYIELPAFAASVDEPASVSDRIKAALAEQWGLGPLTVAPTVLPRLHQAATTGHLTVAVRRSRSVAARPSDAATSGACRTADEAGGRDIVGAGTGGEIVAVWPGLVERVVGVAIDIGSTTVACHLCDLTTGEVLAAAGRMNPQIRFGEDLMSRASYAMMNNGGAEALTAAIHGALDDLVGELLASTSASANPPGGGNGKDPAAGVGVGVGREHVLEIVAVGNPIMHHLALGIDPTPLGQAPFPLATADAVEGPASLLGIEAPSARAYLAPCIAGHVGADTAAAILSQGPHRSERTQLLVDVGTNAEIVLGNRDGLLAASSPTGPAFEGAEIEAGQRATAGAIERVRIDRQTLEPRFKVIGIEPWSDEAGFAAATKATPVTGICGSGIIEVISELFLSGIIDSQGVIKGEAAARSTRVVANERTHAYILAEGVRITQADVRAIQLAKAALRAGIELLMEAAGLNEVDEIRLAGAFGAHIDPLHAMVLGLIPDTRLEQVRSVGNAAGSGALQALLSGQKRAEMERAVAMVTKIETATEPRFQEQFVAALAFPHLTAPTPHLASVVDLPAKPAATGPRRRRQRRGRS